MVCSKLNGAVFIPPGDRDRTVNDPTRANHFGAKLKAQNVLYLHFYNLIRFFALKNLFGKYLMPFLVSRVARLQCLSTGSTQSC